MFRRFASSLTCFAFFGVALTPAQAGLITFDDIPQGPIGDQYLSRGVEFFDGNGSQGNSTAVRLQGGVPVSAYAGNFNTSISQPNIMLAGVYLSNDDIIVQFFDPSDQRTLATSVGIFNDLDGNPSRIYIEGFAKDGSSLGRTQIDGAGAGGIFTAPDIYYAKIYSAPGFGGIMGVDNFSYALVPEPSSIVLLSGGFFGLLIYRRLRNDPKSGA